MSHERVPRREENIDSGHDEALVDTRWFTTLEAAAPILDPGERYHEVALRIFPGLVGLSDIDRLALGSLLVRVHGLHRGIWRGLLDDNPWQVWPLLRVMFELEVTILFVARRPEYFEALTARPTRDRPGHLALPKLQKILREVRDEVPKGSEGYRELSSATHVSPMATWMAYEVRPSDDGLILTGSSDPRFRSEQVPIAASQLRELIDGCAFAFEQLVTAVRLIGFDRTEGSS